MIFFNQRTEAESFGTPSTLAAESRLVSRFMSHSLGAVSIRGTPSPAHATNLHTNKFRK